MKIKTPKIKLPKGKKSKSFKKLWGKKKGLVKKTLAGAVILAFLFLGRSFFIAALVNGRPISRWQIIKTLEKQGGKQTLENLITEVLIIQEARQKGIAVSSEEIDQEIEKVRQNLTDQGQDLDTLLKAQGISLEEVKKQIEIQKILEKLVDQDLEITQEEIDQYKEENKDFLPEEEEGLEEQVKEILKQNKLNAAIQNLLSNLREKAKINYWKEF